jgi:hyperosmotically inducible protein
MRIQSLTLVSTTVAVIALLGLTACSRQQDDRTVGQQVDSAIAKVEQKTDQANAEIKKDVTAAQASGTKMMDATAEKLKDAAITTSINAELARDANLSALKINVDTTAGRVALRGSAPDTAALERATQLAQRVDGVVGVDNQLKIRSN